MNIFNAEQSKEVMAEPIMKEVDYIQFGFVKMRNLQAFCPRCNTGLNAGWNWQPKYCSECGQHIDFSSVEWWKEEKKLGYLKEGDEGYAPIELG